MGFSLKKAFKNIGKAAGDVVKDIGHGIDKGVTGLVKGTEKIGSGIAHGKWDDVKAGIKRYGDYGNMVQGSTSGNLATAGATGQGGVATMGKGLISGDKDKFKQGYKQYRNNAATRFQGVVTAETMAGLTGGENLPSSTEMQAMMQEQQQQTPLQKGALGKTQSIQPLPPTGLQQQNQSIINQATGRSAYVDQMQQPGSQGLQAGIGQPGQQQARQQMGSSSLNELAKRLASSYGLQIGRDQLVDAQGNFMMTPDQLVASSGGSETLGSASSKMNYIASAIQREQTRQAMQKSEAALQAGLGLTSQRRSGSAIEQQQQFYMQLASLYQNQDYEAADFSYFLQKEKQDMELAMQQQEAKKAKKRARAGFWVGVATTIAGAYTGNYGMAAQGLSTAAGSGTDAGYF